MTVAEFMNPKVVMVSTDTPLPKIWSLISIKHIHGLPVVNEDKKLAGFVSKEDMLSKLFPETEDPEEMLSDTDQDIEERLEKLKKMTVDKVMNTRTVYTRADANVMRALSRMIIHKVRQLPVVDDEGHIIGMISKGDIFKGLFRR